MYSSRNSLFFSSQYSVLVIYCQCIYFLLYYWSCLLNVCSLHLCFCLFLSAEERPFKCQHCEKTFRSYGSLNYHRKSHRVNEESVKQVFSCTQCDKTFRNNVSCSYHKMFHSLGGKSDGDRPFKCNQCDKTFCHYSGLSAHKAFHRLGTDSTKCDICDTVLSSLTTLRSHKRTHTGEKPYMCQHCSKTFSTAKDCRLHEQRHNETVQYKCTECNVSFIGSYTLRKHIRVKHTDKDQVYNCPQCPKWYKSKKGLSLHMTSHTGIHWFQISCSNCFMSYKSFFEDYFFAMWTGVSGY